MIFVTLGSQKFQFNRLLIALDNLKINEEIFAQIGYSTYSPMNYNYKKFLNRDEFSRMIDKSDIVITHGGTGVIINSIKKGKKVIAVPRLSSYGEHVDDHQIQLVKEFGDLDLIYACNNTESLEAAIKEIKNMDFKKYESNTSKIIKSIEEFIIEEFES